eukprot:m.126323 g.126323  ORF g.126323 m.126323 type:complete len:177 (-) comp13829_c0_seq1:399-929(-)
MAFRHPAWATVCTLVGLAVLCTAPLSLVSAAEDPTVSPDGCCQAENDAYNATCCGVTVKKECRGFSACTWRHQQYCIDSAACTDPSTKSTILLASVISGAVLIAVCVGFLASRQTILCFGDRQRSTHPSRMSSTKQRTTVPQQQVTNGEARRLSTSVLEEIDLEEHLSGTRASQAK